MHWFVPCLVCCLFIRYFIYYLIVTSFLYSKSGRPREDTRLLSQCWPQVMRCCVCVCVCAWLCVAVCVCVYTYVLLVFLIFFLAGGLLLMFQSLLELVAPSVTTGGGVQECAVPTGHAPWWMCT